LPIRGPIAVTTVLLFALGIAGMSQMQQQFFPDSSRPEIRVDRNNILTPIQAKIES